MTKKVPAANRNYKDTIFRMLFSDRESLLSLYNAVNKRNYTNPNDLEIVTLENAIYMGMKNDLAFILDMNLYLYEHQSTVNPNIPLRDLFYIAAEYQKLIDRKSLYSSAIQKIPTPGFFVFYNGIEPLEDCRISRLSDAFLHTGAEPALELIVTTLNINEGHNCELMQHCRKLKEYAQYVAKVRKYAEQLPLEDAVERAVTECIRENILADFLKNRSYDFVCVVQVVYDDTEVVARDNLRTFYRVVFFSKRTQNSFFLLKVVLYVVNVPGAVVEPCHIVAAGRQLGMLV